MAKTVQPAYDLIFGVHPLLEVLAAKRRKVIAIYTTKPEPKAWRLLDDKLSKATKINYVTRDALHRLAGTTDHQGVVATVEPFKFRKQFFVKEKSPCLVMLDGIQDPRNLGAILRSVHCTGFNGVILCGKGNVEITATAHKSSAGLAEHLDIFLAPTATYAVQELNKAGYKIYLATLDGTRANAATFTTPLCIVIGSEGAGISPEISKTGEKITLPQCTPNISYNASVAAGILLFLVATQNRII